MQWVFKTQVFYLVEASIKPHEPSFKNSSQDTFDVLEARYSIPDLNPVLRRKFHVESEFVFPNDGFQDPEGKTHRKNRIKNTPKLSSQFVFNMFYPRTKDTAEGGLGWPKASLCIQSCKPDPEDLPTASASSSRGSQAGARAAKKLPLVRSQT